MSISKSRGMEPLEECTDTNDVEMTREQLEFMKTSCAKRMIDEFKWPPELAQRLSDAIEHGYRTAVHDVQQ